MLLDLVILLLVRSQLAVVVAVTKRYKVCRQASEATMLERKLCPFYVVVLFFVLTNIQARSSFIHNLLMSNFFSFEFICASPLCVAAVVELHQRIWVRLIREVGRHNLRKNVIACFSLPVHGSLGGV